VAVVHAPAARVRGDAAGRPRSGVAPLDVPVVGPFPDVAGHVVQPEVVFRKGADGRPGAVAVGVTPGELTMPVVREALARALRLVSPNVRGRVEPASCCRLPLGLRRQYLAAPRRVRSCVLMSDVNDRHVLATGERALRAVRVLPARPGRPRPPLAEVTQVDGT